MSHFDARYVTAAELCEALQVSGKTLARWVTSGKIAAPAGPPGARRRWSLEVAAEELRRLRFAVPASWASSGERAA